MNGNAEEPGEKSPPLGSRSGLPNSKSLARDKSFTRIRDADDSAGNSRAGIADRLATIINLGVNNHASPDDRILRSGNGNILHRDFILRFALAISLDIPQVARMAQLGRGETMLMAFRIVMASGAHAIGRRAVAELMNVERMFLTRSESFKGGHDLYRLSVLRESNFPVAFVASSRMQDRDRLLDRGPGIGMRWIGGIERGSEINSDGHAGQCCYEFLHGCVVCFWFCSRQ